METMYWIDVLGKISTVTAILAAVSALFTCILLYAYIDLNGDKSAKIWAKRSFVAFATFLLIAIFTPSEKSLYMIYGVGGAIDYLKENDVARQLPDKVIIALDKWVDAQIEDENKNKQ